jgi:hypothetical protein
MQIEVPEDVATRTLTRKQIEQQAIYMKPEDCAAIHEGLKILAGVCDGAAMRDDMGFNGCDTRIGHSLAERNFLTPKQAVLAKRIILKYHRQLPVHLMEKIKSATTQSTLG